MIERWLDARTLVRNEFIAPATSVGVVAAQARTALAYAVGILGGVAGLLVGWALDAPSGGGAGMWPVGAIALATLAAVFGLIGFSRSYLFIQTDTGTLFASEPRFRGRPIEILQELTPPLDYQMRPRLLHIKVFWGDYTLWAGVWIGTGS